SDVLRRRSRRSRRHFRYLLLAASLGSGDHSWQVRRKSLLRVLHQLIELLLDLSWNPSPRLCVVEPRVTEAKLRPKSTLRALELLQGFIEAGHSRYAVCLRRMR